MYLMKGTKMIKRKFVKITAKKNFVIHPFIDENSISMNNQVIEKYNIDYFYFINAETKQLKGNFYTFVTVKTPSGMFVNFLLVDFQSDEFDLEIIETNKVLYSITYNDITPESTEIGDFSDTGWYHPPQLESFRDIIQDAKDLGIFQDSGRWFESIDPDENYRTGEKRYYNLHFYDLTPATYLRVGKLLKSNDYYTPTSYQESIYKDVTEQIIGSMNQYVCEFCGVYAAIKPKCNKCEKE